MKLECIKTPVGTLQGIGPAAVKLFANLNVFTIADLLTLYPRDYDDRTKIINLSQYKESPKVHTVAKVIAHEWFGYGRMKTLKIIIDDGTSTAQLIAFNRPFLEKSLPIGAIIVVSGVFLVRYGALQSTSFETIKLSSVWDNDTKSWGEKSQINNSLQYDDNSQASDFYIEKPEDNYGNDLYAILNAFKNKPLPDSKVLPIYPLTEGLNQKTVRKAQETAIKQYALGIDDELPSDIIKKRNLLAKKDAIRLIHLPKCYEDAKKARQTLIYEELYHFQYAMAERAFKHRGFLPNADITKIGCTINAFTSQNIVHNATTSNSISQNGINTGVQNNTNKTYEEDFDSNFVKNLSPRQTNLLKQLPFDLTSDQKLAIYQMNCDIDKGYKDRTSLLKNDSTATPQIETIKSVFTMARLLQGDVGSGKTLVAIFACLRAVDWGGQCAIMAPTELLARQHAENVANFLKNLKVQIAFLTGKLQSAGRSQLLKALKSGEIDIIIGTHALFSNSVLYKDLQLVVIDEQHRFGVTQRNAIISKGLQISSEYYVSPHLLMMSATPIPQTLALTAFGDLDVSTIKTLPNGRKPITTYLVCEGNEKNAYEAVRKELNKGHQAYFVYPAIEKSELETSQEKTTTKNAEEMFEYLSTQVYPEYNCAILHSKVDEETQINVLKEFRNGKIQILVATTVVEVGVDIPNATCMVVENADYFGLAQLHQLRGRVGRGSESSYCFLIYSKKITEIGKERIKALRESTNGFVIAEQDLKLRGPGELTGTIQAGNLVLGIADLQRDMQVLLQARQDAFDTMQRKIQDALSE